jgi:hypothetical protein
VPVCSKIRNERNVKVFCKMLSRWRILFSRIKEETTMWRSPARGAKTWKISFRMIISFVPHLGFGHLLFWSLFLYQWKDKASAPLKTVMCGS